MSKGRRRADAVDVQCSARAERGSAPGTETGSALWPSAGVGWYTTLLLAGAYFLAYLDRAIIGLLVEPIKVDLRLSDTELGLLTGFSFALFYATAGLLLGRLADSRNRKWLVAAAIVVWSATTALCGLARSFAALFFARLCVGVGEAGLNPAALSIISDLFPRERRHFAITTFNVGGALGGGTAFILGAVILAFAETLAPVVLPFAGRIEPWQWTFILVATPGFVLAAIVSLTVREPARRGSVTVPGKAVGLGEVAHYFRANARCFTGLFVAPSFMYMINLGYLAWAPALFVRVHHLDLKLVGAAFGGTVLASSIAGNFICAMLVRRYEGMGCTDAPLRAMRLVATIAAPFACFGALAPNPYLAMAMLGPGVGLLVATVVLPNIAIQTIVPNRLRGQSVALFLLCVNLIGGGLGPLAIGLLTDHVFRDGQLIAYSTTTLAVIVLPLALAGFHWALPGYRQTASATAPGEIVNVPVPAGR